MSFPLKFFRLSVFLLILNDIIRGRLGVGGVKWHGNTPLSVHHTTGKAARDFFKSPKQVRTPHSIPFHAHQHILSSLLPFPTPLLTASIVPLCSSGREGSRATLSYFSWALCGAGLSQGEQQQWVGPSFLLIASPLQCSLPVLKQAGRWEPTCCLSCLQSSLALCAARLQWDKYCLSAAPVVCFALPSMCVAVGGQGALTLAAGVTAPLSPFPESWIFQCIYPQNLLNLFSSTCYRIFPQWQLNFKNNSHLLTTTVNQIISRFCLTSSNQ